MKVCENEELYYSINNNEVVVTSATKTTKEKECLIIPDKIDGFPVTMISECAFMDDGYSFVKLPKHLKMIEDSAFESNNLSEIDFPEELEVIGESSFRFNNLKAIHITKNIRCVGVESFSGNQNISKITADRKNRNYKSVDGLALTSSDGFVLVSGTNSGFVPESVRIIGEGAFCEVLDHKKIEIPEGVREIKPSSYSMCNIEEISLPNSLIKIGDFAFYANKIKTLEIPGNTVSIGASAFAHNDIRNIFIPLNVEFIGRYAFEGRTIEKINVFLASNLKENVVVGLSFGGINWSPFGKEFELMLSKSVNSEVLLDLLEVDEGKLTIVDEQMLRRMYEVKSMYS